MTSDLPAPDDWLSRQVEGFRALAGRVVSGWDGIEMALRESTPAGIAFTDPQVPFVQLVWVRLSWGQEQITISTYQEDHGFGLVLRDRDPFRPEACAGIYRWRTLDLPLGPVDAVEVTVEQEILATVTLTIGGRDLLLVAGEVYETWTDALEVHRLDESVLVFTDPTDAETVEWV